MGAWAERTLARYHSGGLAEFMNGAVREWLNRQREVIPGAVLWGGQATQVFTHLEGDFMKDAIADVDEVLASGGPPWLQTASAR